MVVVVVEGQCASSAELTRDLSTHGRERESERERRMTQRDRGERKRQMGGKTVGEREERKRGKAERRGGSEGEREYQTDRIE